MQYRRDRHLEALVGVARDQLHAGEATGHQAAQKGEPERAILAWPHVEAQDLALPCRRVEPNRNDEGLCHYPTLLPSLEESGVEPDVGKVRPRERARAKALDLAIQFL